MGFVVSLLIFALVCVQGCATPSGTVFSNTPKVIKITPKIEKPVQYSAASPQAVKSVYNPITAYKIDLPATSLVPQDSYSQVSRANNSIRFVTACTFRRVGLNNLADFFDLLSDSAIKDIAVPLDKFRTVQGNSWTMKMTADLDQKTDSLFVGFSINF